MMDGEAAAAVGALAAREGLPASIRRHLLRAAADLRAVSSGVPESLSGWYSARRATAARRSAARADFRAAVSADLPRPALDDDDGASASERRRAQGRERSRRWRARQSEERKADERARLDPLPKRPKRARVPTVRRRQAAARRACRSRRRKAASDPAWWRGAVAARGAPEAGRAGPAESRPGRKWHTDPLPRARHPPTPSRFTVQGGAGGPAPWSAAVRLPRPGRLRLRPGKCSAVGAVVRSWERGGADSVRLRRTSAPRWRAASVRSAAGGSRRSPAARPAGGSRRLAGCAARTDPGAAFRTPDPAECPYRPSSQGFGVRLSPADPKGRAVSRRAGRGCLMADIPSAIGRRLTQ